MFRLFFYALVQIFDLGNKSYAKTSQETSPKGEGDWKKLTVYAKIPVGAIQESPALLGICECHCIPYNIRRFY